MLPAHEFPSLLPRMHLVVVLVRVRVARLAALGIVERRLGLVRLHVVQRAVRRRAAVLGLALGRGEGDEATDETEKKRTGDGGEDDRRQPEGVVLEYGDKRVSVRSAYTRLG